LNESIKRGLNAGALNADVTKPAINPIMGVNHTPPLRAVAPGACDCHTHVFGAHTTFPLASDRMYTPGEAHVEELARLLQALGLSRVVIVQPSPYGEDNRCTLDGIARLAGEWGIQARGVAVIDPARITDAELNSLHRGGIRGARVNLETSGHNDTRLAQQAVRAVSERVAHLGWHVQTFTNLPIIDALADTVAQLPTPLVIDHYGRAEAALGLQQKGFDTLLQLLAAGNTYVKLSAPHRIARQTDTPEVAAIARALIDANTDAILWGTDWPHPGAWPGVPRALEPIERFHPIDDGYALNLLCGWTTSDTELDKILVANPAKLYGFEN
jgi:predicted TIM-barrel fold metal-dependent hydrolase